MNGYDSDMAPELLLRSGKRTTEPALSRRWRLLQASTKLKCVKGPCEIADLKRRLTVTSRPHGKDDRHQRLQDGVSEDERWSLIKMVNLQVNRLQDGCSGDEMRAAWATSSESSNGNSEKQRDEPAASSALRVDKARRVKEGSSNRRTAGAPRMMQCRFEQRE